MSAARHRGLVIAMMLVAASWLATLVVDRAPASKPLDAAPSEFSGARAKALLQRLVGDNVPHPLGSPANAQLRERIVATLLGMGLTPALQSGDLVCSSDGVCGVPTNILQALPPTATGRHLDWLYRSPAIELAFLSLCSKLHRSRPAARSNIAILRFII